MPNELGIDSKFKKTWNIKGSYDLNTQWFHVDLFQINDATLQKHPRWLKVFFHESYSWFQPEKTYERKTQ